MQEENGLKVTRKRKADLPLEISSPQIVKIGDCVFLGGGYRKEHAEKTAFQYRTPGQASLSVQHAKALPH